MDMDHFYLPHCVVLKINDLHQENLRNVGIAPFDKCQVISQWQCVMWGFHT
jgi:hypothetical protein